MRHRCQQLAIGVFLAWISFAASGCGSGNKPRQEPVLAEAWTGPITLGLREEISPRSRVIATTRHGQTLEVVQVRRRFVRVRTEDGKTGWTEMRNLLNTEQIEALRRLAKTARELPSQGQATVYETLNMHTEPSRPSTNFYQIGQGMK